MEKAKPVETSPLSDEEIQDVKEFYASKKNHKIRSLDELLDELHRE